MRNTDHTSSQDETKEKAEEKEKEKEEEVKPHRKSNNPHLTGGEKKQGCRNKSKQIKREHDLGVMSKKRERFEIPNEAWNQNSRPFHLCICIAISSWPTDLSSSETVVHRKVSQRILAGISAMKAHPTFGHSCVFANQTRFLHPPTPLLQN